MINQHKYNLLINKCPALLKDEKVGGDFSEHTTVSLYHDKSFNETISRYSSTYGLSCGSKIDQLSWQHFIFLVTRIYVYGSIKYNGALRKTAEYHKG